MQQRTKRPAAWGEMDSSLCDLSIAINLLDAVRVAVGTGDLPPEAAEDATFGAEMLLRRICDDLRTECDAAFTGDPEPP